MARNKFFNKPCFYNGIKFDSTKERDRYIYLSRLRDEGKIFDLVLQPEYILLPTQYREVTVQLKTKTKTVLRVAEKQMSYTADFSYVKDGQPVVEDVKGSKKTITEEFRIKKKLMLYFFGISVKVVLDAREPV